MNARYDRHFAMWHGVNPYLCGCPMNEKRNQLRINTQLAEHRVRWRRGSDRYLRCRRPIS